jgi:alkanesulfonate monooxygenase SsuD/methylene tetrahydromethanopterin reductase-like flavin-dependent oxidoreductase (luciferase family)
LILGIGSGWFERDYNEYGYEFGTAPGRLKALGHNLPIIKERWAKLVPAPIRNPIPILIGGGGEKVTLRLTAEHANLWNGFGPVDTFRHKNGVLTEWCEKLGRDPAAIDRTVMVGSQELDQLDTYIEAGATHILTSWDAPFDPASIRKLVAWRDAQG